MPEAAPSQSATAPPPNGHPPSAPGSPAPSSEASPKPDVAKSEAPTPEQRLLQLSEQERKLTLEKMRIGRERKAASEQLAKQMADLTSREAKLKDWEAERADRKRNPAKYLTADYGPDWYDKLSQVKLSGSPPVDLIASEMDERLKAIQKEMDERDAKWGKKLEERDESERQRFRTDYFAGAIAHVKGSPDKYPLIHAAGALENIPQVIQQHWDATVKKSEETGEVEPGELLTPEQAADKLEKYIEGLANKALEAKQKREQPAPTQTPQRPQQGRIAVPNPPRRELSTDLTASGTAAPSPARTDKERMERAIAAAKAHMSQRQTG